MHESTKVMRKKTLFLSLFGAIFAPLSLSGQTLQNKIEEILQDPALKGAVVSVCVESPQTGNLVNIQSDKLLIPSSNLKLITTGVALKHFGRNYNFSTQLSYDGEIQDSTLLGNLYIIGGGDPTLGSSDVIAVKETELFERWKQAIHQAGIKKIQGRILADGRFLNGMKESPLWQFDDIGTYYGSGTSGLQWHENYISLKVTGGEFVGDSLQVEFVGPNTPWMDYRMHCSTGERGSGDRLYLYTNDESETAILTGTFGLGKPTKNLKVSNKFPERTCAYLFSEYLQQQGISHEGYGAFDKIEKTQLTSPQNARLLCLTPSPSLWEIAKSCNTESNNIYAETLLRILGKDMCQNACYDSCYVALERVLKEIGVECRDSSGRKIDGIIMDGSGLARHNLVSTSFLCDFLLAMMKTDCYKDYLGTIPQPGLQGTVRPCLRLIPSSERRRMRIKSGSMSGIQCYSGYALPQAKSEKQETLVFSLIINNTTADSYQLRKITDAVLTAILEENK